MLENYYMITTTSGSGNTTTKAVELDQESPIDWFIDRANDTILGLTLINFWEITEEQYKRYNRIEDDDHDPYDDFDHDIE